MSAAQIGPTLSIPDRETLVRDGIPPEVMQHFRDRAVVLRAQAFADAARWLRDVTRGRRPRAAGGRPGPRVLSVLSGLRKNRQVTA